MQTIKIKGEEYKFKYTIRAIFMWENIMNKTFSPISLMDNYVFFYCMILANNQDKVLEWNDFLDALDEDPLLIKTLTDAVNQQQILQRMQAENDTNDGGEKKS